MSASKSKELNGLRVRSFLLQQILADLTRLSHFRPAAFTKFVRTFQREKKGVDRQLAVLQSREDRQLGACSRAAQAGKRAVRHWR